jgi:hypothetical protein
MNTDAAPPASHEEWLGQFGPTRALREKEAKLIKKLAAGTPLESKIIDQLATILVQDMPDGGMGSLYFWNGPRKNRRLGKTLAEGCFSDADNTPVYTYLDLDEAGDLFELDMWKVDSSALLRFPEPDDVQVTNRTEPEPPQK